MIKIAITDDHPLLLNGLQQAIEAHGNMEIMGTYNNGSRLLNSLANTRPDVLLLDLQLSSDPQGSELVKMIKSKYPEIRILILTSNDNAYNIQLVLNSGADGYLLKNIEMTLLTDAIEKVYHGEEYLSPEVKDILLNSLRKNSSNLPGSENLTEREIQILQLIAEEKTSQEIGSILHLSYRTIETYRLAIMQKLGVKNMVGMTKKAIMLGIIK